MKSTILTLLASLLTASVFAQSPATPAPASEAPSPAAAPAAHAPWSVVGMWHCTHPDWHDVLTLNADGSFSREQGYTGTWKLEVQKDRLVLVLAWKDWDPESVTMYGPDDFRGAPRNDDDTDRGDMVLHRLAPLVGPLQSDTVVQPLRHPLSDERFAQIKDFAAYIHGAFDAGTAPQADVSRVDLLLDKARYMHGDISREEWFRLHDEKAGELMRLDVARFRAGAGSLAEILLLQDDVLESSR